MHDRKVLHRDLKSKNIFFNKNGLVQIGDFGISKLMVSEFALTRTHCGTPFYMSPEVHREQSYTFSSDIWSLGIILYRLCALKYPFDETSGTSYMRGAVRKDPYPIPKYYSAGIWEIIDLLLNKEP